jgi:hypothetical protein
MKSLFYSQKRYLTSKRVTVNYRVGRLDELNDDSKEALKVVKESYDLDQNHLWLISNMRSPHYIMHNKEFIHLLFEQINSLLDGIMEQKIYKLLS